MRSCWNSGLIRPFTSRSEDAHSSSAASTDPPAIAAIHDRQIMVAQRARTRSEPQL
jgi:hypothetical protein